MNAASVATGVQDHKSVFHKLTNAMASMTVLMVLTRKSVVSLSHHQPAVLQVYHVFFSFSLYFSLSTEKPRMIQQPEKSYTVEKGKSITLSCRASGFPKPTIEWRFNFQKVPMVASSQISVCTTCHNCTENEAISSLTLANFDERLEGKWTCEAVNSVDTSLAPHDTDLALRPASSYVSGVY